MRPDQRLSSATRLAVAAGGIAGAGGRWAVLELAPGDAQVWALGTLNVSGSAVLGLLVALAVARTWSAPLRLGLAAGFCGGLTSLSSLALRLGDSIETGDPWSAAAEVALSVALGIVCYRVGVWLGESGRSSTRASPIRRAQA